MKTGENPKNESRYDEDLDDLAEWMKEGKDISRPPSAIENESSFNQSNSERQHSNPQSLQTISMSHISASCANESSANISESDNIQQRYRQSALGRFIGKMPWMKKLECQLADLDRLLLTQPDSFDLAITWAYEMRYIAWALIILAILVCSFFIMLYSMQWGKDISEEWLSTFFLSFLQSVTVVDPFKALFLSVLIAIVIKKSNVASVDELDLIRVSDVNREYGIKEKSNPPREHLTNEQTLSKKELQKATLRRKVHVMIRNVLTELFVHLIFIALVISLCYTNRTSNDHHMHSTIYSNLIDPPNEGFRYINSTSQYFDWLENVATPWLFPEVNYRGESIISEDRQYTALHDLYRLGAPRLRQLRMSSGKCDSKFIMENVDLLDCIDKYDMLQEDRTEYCLGWTDTPCPLIDMLRVTAGAWHFNDPFDIWGLPVAGDYGIYGGGGYIANLDINSMIAKAVLKEVKENFWIDRHTRAVFLEFTLFNPNINHFSFVTLLTEFPETGGVVTFAHVYPFRVYKPTGFLGAYITLCEIASLLFAAIGLVYIIFVLCRQKCQAFKDFWFLVDFVAVVMALTTIGLFYTRLESTKQAMQVMKEDSTKFVNFQQVVVWDTAFLVCLAFLVAISCFRLLKLAGYSKRTMRVYVVLKLATKDMPSFFTYIIFLLISFATTGVLLFGTHAHQYRDFYHSLATTFTAICGYAKFKETNLPEADKRLSNIYITIFGSVVLITLTNLLLAILLELLTVSAQKDSEAVKSENAKVFAVLWASILKKLGFKRDPSEVLDPDMTDDNVDSSDKELSLEEKIIAVWTRLDLHVTKLGSEYIIKEPKAILKPSDPVKSRVPKMSKMSQLILSSKKFKSSTQQSKSNEEKRKTIKQTSQPSKTPRKY